MNGVKITIMNNNWASENKRNRCETHPCVVIIIGFKK